MLKIQIDPDEVKQALRGFEDQLPFALALAATRVKSGKLCEYSDRAIFAMVETE